MCVSVYDRYEDWTDGQQWAGLTVKTGKTEDKRQFCQLLTGNENVIEWMYIECECCKWRSTQCMKIVLKWKVTVECTNSGDINLYCLNVEIKYYI